MSLANGRPGHAEEPGPAEKRALLARLLREKAGKRAAGDLHPLSHAQRALWYLQQLDTTGRYCNMAFTCRIAAPVDIEPLLQRAFQSLTDRHPMLRTTYVVRDNRPYQLVHSQRAVALKVIDAADWSAAYLNEQMKAEGGKVFDLENETPLRLTLFRSAGAEHVLLVTMHHIAMDLWTLMLLMSELQALTISEVTGIPAPLPPRATYTDFVRWESEMLDSPEGQAHWEYWRRQLGGELPVLDLPADFSRPAIHTYRGAQHSFRLSKELSRRLKELARDEQSTLFSLLLSAFQVFVGRYTGQNDILIGSLVAGRGRPEFERVVGMFANGIPLRADLNGDPPFRAFLGQVRRVVNEAMAHQDFPFYVLVERLLKSRDASRAPLGNITFIVYNARPLDSGGQGTPVSSVFEAVEPAERAARTAVGDISGDIAPLDLGVAKADLDLAMYETGSAIGGVFCYCTDLFSAATIERMAANFETLLEGIVENPDRHLSELPILSAGERSRLLVDWNASRVDGLADRDTHQIIEDWAARTPDAVALVGGTQSLTFRELNARANQLARHLRALGVGPDSRVGICFERSLDAAIALLAVQKAGGAFVPLDPNSPPSRLAFQFQDAAISLLVTRRHYLSRQPDSVPPHVCVDNDRDAIARQCEDNLEPVSNSDKLAYVIYTSGSTGRPKGVPITRRALVGHCRVIADRFGLCCDDRVLQFAPLVFDVSVEEIFASWVAGATVVLAPEDGPISLAGFLEFVRLQRLTVVGLPAPFWHEWVAELPRLTDPVPACLRLVATGSDTVSAERFGQWQRLVGDRVRLLCAYGPTEATVTATVYEHRAGDPLPSGPSVPIGRPLPNTEVYVLDATMNPVPIGVEGELYLGGDRLTPGYLNRPELTAEKLVPHPFRHGAGARLYRTGDRARWLSDGNLEFLGRADHQVKVRGYRVEPGEIEAALVRHPGVREAVVVPRSVGAGGNTLAAYVVPKTSHDAWTHRGGLELWPAPGDYGIYDAVLYHAMTHGEVRNRAYREAIAQRVKGKVVVDLGTGKDAILARFCVEAGARKVYALEALEDAFQQACECVRDLGLYDRITVLRGESRAIHLPEPADVCVSDVIGVIGGSEGAVAVLNDAWRFLRPDGCMIPERCATLVAAAQLPDVFLQNLSFSEMSGDYVERIFAQVGGAFDLRLCLKNAGESLLISDSDVFEDLDFSARIEPNYERTIRLKVTRDGRLDGFLLWLNLHTIKNEVVDNLRTESNWLPVYLPVFHPGIDVREGDEIEATCAGTLSDDGRNPDYQICGRLLRGSGEAIEFEHYSRHHGKEFRANPFYESLFSDGQVKITKERPPEVNAGELREFLRQHLPHYMIPSSFALLESLPLTATGKVDRKALPEVQAGHGHVEYTAPRTALEVTLANAWAEVLGRDRVGVFDNFFELGGHSLQAMQLASRLTGILGRDLPVRLLFLQPTVAALAEAIEGDQGRSGPATGFDLTAEAVLDPAIRVDPASEPPVKNPANILLTGATGFLGAFLLHDLLAQTRASIHCLVRAADAATGQARLREHLSSFGLWSDSFANRIEAVPGDLSEPLLGLSPDAFDRLARVADVVYHNGALVNMVYPYSRLKSANVQGTQEALRLACRHRVKPFHYISTVSVFPPPNGPQDEPIGETEAPASGAGLAGGYAQSKWVAERLVGIAGARGLPVTIYRPGRITGHSVTGICPPNDLLVDVLRELTRAGAIPDIDSLEEMTPVDYVSQAIVYLSRKPASRGKFFHLLNQDHVSMRTMLAVLNRRGYGMKVLPFAEWLGGLGASQGAEGVAGLPLLLWFGRDPSAKNMMMSLGMQEFDCRQTVEALNGSGIRCPAADEPLLETYVDYLIQSGLLSQPAATVGP